MSPRRILAEIEDFLLETATDLITCTTHDCIMSVVGRTVIFQQSCLIRNGLLRAFSSFYSIHEGGTSSMRQDAAKELVMGLASMHLEVDPNEH